MPPRVVRHIVIYQSLDGLVQDSPITAFVSEAGPSYSYRFCRQANRFSVSDAARLRRLSATFIFYTYDQDHRKR